MRKAALGMSVALLAGVALAACGNEPEPIGPIEPAFDRTTETTDPDTAEPMVPGTTLPDAEPVPPVGSQPGEIPEVMEPGPTPGIPGGDTTTGTLDPAVPAEEPTDEFGTPQ
ncbi:hypothetical protein [Hyphomonas sp.]|uniref:hypothetical protein n=1 Tax=Hyphomonas sp. TaxID=87 RepID=UPI0025BAAFCD|nr:hypothetical protein [Hyphomonas sp.]